MGVGFEESFQQKAVELVEEFCDLVVVVELVPGAWARYVAPPTPAGVPFDFADCYLMENTQRFTTRFEEWHKCRNR